MKKILSIDDEPGMLTCLKSALESEGYQVLTTGDPDEGEKLFRENEDISMLTLDVKMPKKNGFEIYKDFKKIRTAPVLFVTAYPRSFSMESDDIMDLWKNEFTDGDTDIIYKPFELSALFDKVEALVGKAEE